MCREIKSWEQDMFQLAFETIMFPLLVFLLRTVLVYDTLFDVVGCCLWLLKACWFTAKARFILLLLASMVFLLTPIYYYPLFIFMLNIKDPWRLPGGYGALPILIRPENIYFRPRLVLYEARSGQPVREGQT